jgi:hypothetical protein
MATITHMKEKDLLEVVPPFIAQGSSAMVRLLELPPGDPGLAPHRHSGPVFGYMLEGAPSTWSSASWLGGLPGCSW